MIRYGGHPVIGFGQDEPVAPTAAKTASPWPTVFASSLIGAAATWVIEEVANTVRKKKR